VISQALNNYADEALKRMGVLAGKIEGYEELRKKVIAGLRKNYSDTAIRCFIEKRITALYLIPTPMPGSPDPAATRWNFI